MMRFATIALLLLMAVGCAPSLYHQGVNATDSGDYAKAAGLFYDEIRLKPDSHAAWRELGVSFYKAGEFDKAAEALEQANKIKMEAKTSLYMGLTFEEAGRFDDALTAYRTALGLEPKGKTKRMIRAHFDSVVRARVQKEIETALTNESGLETSGIEPGTIAVVDFESDGLPAEVAPLTRGLVEFTALDLGKVHSLKVVERAKLQYLLRELKLSESNLVDPATRLRVGKLVGSQNLISGSMQLVGDDRLEVYGVVGNTVEGSARTTEPTSGALDDFFAVQKKFVFEIIDSMNIKLTAAERSAIEEVPTESYLALLAYCRGLEYQDAGDYTRAAASFGAAAGEDKGFTAAATQAEVAGEIVEMSGGTGQETLETFAAAVTSEVGDPTGQQQSLASIVDNTSFLPSNDLGGLETSVTANVPDTGIVGPVTVIVIGEVNGSN